MSYKSEVQRKAHRCVCSFFVCEQTVGKGELPKVSVGVWQVKQISRAIAAFWLQSSNLNLPGLES